MSSRPDNTSNRQVNNLLTTLRYVLKPILSSGLPDKSRGEQFRHSQNVRGSRSHVSSLRVTVHSPTLPAGLFGPDYPVSDPPEAKPEALRSASRPCSGPSPPKSWTLTSPTEARDTPDFRASALSIIFSHLSSASAASSPVPPLTLLCLRKLVSLTTVTEFREDVVPFIPPHLRRDLIHYTAIWSPLSNTRLFPLFDLNGCGHAAGELVIVGPSAYLPDDYLSRSSPRSHRSDDNTASTVWDRGDWDQDDWNQEQSPLHTFILVSTRLSMTTLVNLPPTLTHVALINLSVAVTLHRLPSTCPLIVCLDISYNTWLSETAATDTGIKMLERVDWSRWVDLKVLGYRECHVFRGLLAKVNKGRWDEVEVIQ